MVGSRCIDFEDLTRKEVLGDRKGNRRIAVRFYYPGKEGSQKEVCRLLNDSKLKIFIKKPDFSNYDKNIRVYETPEMRNGTFPLILFSHGYSGFAEQNSYLCQYLADHGYIVASISHNFEASETDFNDGTVTKLDRSLIRKMYRNIFIGLIEETILTKKKLSDKEALKQFDIQQKKQNAFLIDRLYEWEKDDLAAISHIHELAEDENSFLYHRIDFSNGIGATGHSFGGATAYCHCLYDDEVSCGINIDGGLFGDFKEEVNHKPFMQIINKSNYNVVTRCRLYHDGPLHFIIFRNMKHIGFTDIKLLGGKPSIVGTADPETAMNALNEANLAFFDRYLKEGKKEDRTKLSIDEKAFESYEAL